MGRICRVGNKWKTLKACRLLECAGQDTGSRQVKKRFHHDQKKKKKKGEGYPAYQHLNVTTTNNIHDNHTFQNKFYMAGRKDNNNNNTKKDETATV